MSDITTRLRHPAMVKNWHEADNLMHAAADAIDNLHAAYGHSQQQFLDAAAEIDRLRARAEAAEKDAARYLVALQNVAALHPSIDSPEGYNEWGEADCFNQAQQIANAAITAAPAAQLSPPALRRSKRDAACGDPGAR